MPVNPSAYDADPETGLALRILFSALIRCAGISFGKFWREYFPLGSTLDVRTAIECCQLALCRLAPARRGILLLVDESVKLAHASGPASATRMLMALGLLLDSHDSSKLNVVCSTLDAPLLNSLWTSSGRAISYVPLPELSQGTAEAMFATALATTSSLPPSVRIAISDCSGHLRTLEHLLQAARDASPRFELGDLRNRTVPKLMAGDTPQWAVLAALRGDKLKLSDIVPDCGWCGVQQRHYQRYVHQHDSVRLECVVPKLSMMHLLRFADAQGDSSHLTSPIWGMTAAEESACSLKRPSLGGEPFELFSPISSSSSQLSKATVSEAFSSACMSCQPNLRSRGCLVLCAGCCEGHALVTSVATGSRTGRP